MALLHNKKCRVGPLTYCQQITYNGMHTSANLFLRHRLAGAKNLFRKDLKGHFGCVNAIEFSNNGGEMIASGGDDRRVLVWNTEKCVSNCCIPVPMNGQHHSNIFCLAFDNSNSKVFSGGNDEQVVVHDIETRKTVDVFLHEEAVYGLSVDPINDRVFSSACDDGRVLLYDIRASPGEDPFCVAECNSPMHSVMYNPVEPRLLATANAKEGLALWDVRKPKSPLLRYGGKDPAQSCMSVRISRDGNTLIALRRRLPPVIYNMHQSASVCQFDHNGYYNSCTMKSCCFAGDNDQYLISGSDDFNLYVWKIPDADEEVKWVPEAHMVLKGHRSIANQVRFNPANHLVISSGVEKIIKMWSPFPVPYCQGDLGDGEFDYSERPVYTHEEYINLILRSGQVMSHDYSHQSTDEDPRMMAFFDSLVQRELEGWSTDDSADDKSDSSTGNLQSYIVASHSSDDSDDTLSNQSFPVGDGEDDRSISPFTMAFAMAVAHRERQVEARAAGNDAQDAGENSGERSEAAARPEDYPFLDVNSSFLERLEQLDNMPEEAGGSGTNSLPGQRHNPARKSITELINQKRKEYLAKANKKDKRNKKGETSETKDMVAMDTESTSCSSSSSSSQESLCSDSDSGKEGTTKSPNRKLIKRSIKVRSKGKKRKCDSPVSSDEETVANTNKNATDVLKELAAERDKKLSNMKRLKLIRSQAMMDLSTLPNDGGSTEKENDINENVENCNQDSTNCSVNLNATVSGNVQHRDSDRNDLTSENGIEQYDNRTKIEGIIPVDNGDIHNGNAPQLIEAVACVGANKITAPPVNTLCDNETNNGSVNGHCNSVNGHSSNISHSVNNGSPASNVDSVNDTDAQPTWTEFKRFRNRVERAHRKYRRSSSHRENSTCSSGEEN